MAKVNTDWGNVFGSRTAADGPHTGVHLGSLGGKITGNVDIGRRG